MVDKACQKCAWYDPEYVCTCPDNEPWQCCLDKEAAADQKKAVAQSIYKQKSDGVNRALKKHPRYEGQKMATKKRLIDADAFIEDIKTEITELFMNGLKGTPQQRDHLYDFVNRIGEQPTVDAVEVVHGRWEHDSIGFSDFWTCAACRKDFFFDDDPTVIHARVNYCPNCGAKMDGGNEDG